MKHLTDDILIKAGFRHVEATANASHFDTFEKDGFILTQHNDGYFYAEVDLEIETVDELKAAFEKKTGMALM